MTDAYDEAAAEIMRYDNAVSAAIDEALENPPEKVVCCGFKAFVDTKEYGGTSYVFFVGVTEDGVAHTFKLPADENIGVMLEMSEEKAEEMLFRWKVKLN